MLATLLRCSTRRAWRGLGQANALQVAVGFNIATHPHWVQCVRSFSSTLSESDSGDKSTDQSSGWRGGDEAAGGEGSRNRPSFMKGQKVVAALKVYKEIHGDTLVPQLYVVPSGDRRWPLKMWGYRLGYAVQTLRREVHNGKVSAWAAAELKKMKFVKNVSQYRWDEIVLPSLQVYRQEYGHCIVERSFKVPARPPWPEKAWGNHLGALVNRMRVGECYVEQAARDQDMLDQIGFAWDSDVSIWNERIIPSMRECVAQYGHCHVNLNFVVPSRHPWLRCAWGMHLGMKLYHMQRKGTYFAIIGRDVARLQELGFSFELDERPWKKWVVPLLDIYETAFGDRQIPLDFVIPSASPWPQPMWGVALGFIVARNAHYLRREVGDVAPV